MKKSEMKKQAIRDAIEYLKKCPNGKRERRRKPHIRIKHLKNRKVFFDIFIPKMLLGNINDQYRRLKDIPFLLKKTLSTQPEKNGNKYVFLYESYRVVVEEKFKSGKIKELYLLTFFPT
jgi:hypothetical protein